MAKRQIFILGAGLSGLSAAWHLQSKNIECEVIEKESEVGGLCRSKDINGFIFDYDGHLLHFKRRYAFDLVRKLLKNGLVEHTRSAWVYSHNCFTRYPFQANLYGLPPDVIKECILGLVKTKANLKDRKNSNFLDWIAVTFGAGIAKHFMIPYNSKFWTIPPQELNCSWLDGFIPVPSLDQIIEGSVGENKQLFGYNAHFWYPKEGGINKIPQALAGQIKNIRTNSRISEIDLGKRLFKLDSGEKQKFDCLISTIALPELLHIIKAVPRNIESCFKNLRWNSIFNLNLGMKKHDPSGRHWVYFPQQEISFFRVGFYNNFLSGHNGKYSLYVEVSYSKNKPLGRKGIVKTILDDLRRIGLLGDKDKIMAQDINDIKYGYPIYDKNYNMARDTILKFLSKNKIIPCGRYGSWRYMSMEDAIMDGKDVHEKIAGGV